VGAFFMGELRLFMGELRLWQEAEVCELCLGQKAGVFRPKLDLGAKKMTQVD